MDGGKSKMKIQTTRFGEVEIVESSCFEMISPILGYENENQFVIIEHKEKSNFKWLQSTKTPNLAFAITMPGFFGIEYVFELPDTTQEELGIEDADDIVVFNIVIIPHENPRASTVNLLAPIIFNVKNQKASQVILTGTNFRVDCPLFEKEAVC